MNTWAVLSRKRLLAAILVAMACAICILAGPALAQPATQDTNDKADSAAIVDGQESAGESDAEAGADGEGNDAEGVDGANAEGNVAEAAGDDANGNADGEGQEEEGASVVNPKTQAEEYAITVKNSEYGTVEDVPEKASAGDTVTVSVKPNTGYALSSLKYTAGSESDTITAATNGKYSFKMPAANVQIQAEFAKTYEVTIGEASNGTIKLDGPDGEDVTKLKAMKGDIVTVSATPSSKSYAVKSVTYKLKESPKQSQDITSSLNKDGKYVFKMADGDVEVNAEFAAFHTVTANKATNGTVIPDVKKAIEGEDVNVTVKPSSGYELTKLTYTPKGGSAKTISKGSSGAYTFAMPDADVAIDATFAAAAETYTVTVTSATGGTVTSNVKAASEGDTVALTVSPSSGYSLSSLSYTTADGKSTSISAPVNGKTTFKMPASDVTVNPVFTRAAATSYTITFDKNATDATGTMNAQTVQAGQATPLTANTFKRTGYTFKSWNTARDGKGTTYSDKANITPTANMTLYAQWTKSSTASTAASGGKTPKTGDTLPVGALVATGLVVAIASLGAAMYARRRMTKR